MIWAGSRPAASWHPAPSSFPHQPVPSVSTNPFRFIGLHTLSHNGNSLPSSFQQLTHSFPSHGTRPSLSPVFEFRISNFGRPLSLVFATLTNSRARKSCICHSYENTGVAPISSQFGTPRVLSIAVEPSKPFKPSVLQILPLHQLQWNVPKEPACR
jgi:hypothetical protein